MSVDSEEKPVSEAVLTRTRPGFDSIVGVGGTDDRGPRGEDMHHAVEIRKAPSTGWISDLTECKRR